MADCSGGWFLSPEEEAAFHWNLADAMFRVGEVEEACNTAYDAKQLLPAHLHVDIDQALATYSVHLRAATAKQPNGETDWYAVLNVEPFWNLADIKRNYQLLAKRVHPDKNRSAAADDAFRLVREAWERISARGTVEYIIIID